MDTIERAKEIARLYAEVEALTEQIEALLEGGTPSTTHTVKETVTAPRACYALWSEHAKLRA
jgi:hypothetical protein